MNIAEKIIQRLLALRGLKYDETRDFFWKIDGLIETRMHTFIQTKFMNDYDDRKLLTTGFVKLIGSEPAADYLVGIANLGGVFASDVGQSLGIKTFYSANDVVYEYAANLFDPPWPNMEYPDFDHVVACSVLAIPFAVALANKLRKSLVYLKRDGKRCKLNRKTSWGAKLFLVTYGETPEGLSQIKNQLADHSVCGQYDTIDHPGRRIVSPEEIRGKTAILIGNDFGLTRNVLSPLTFLRKKKGMVCNECYHVFSYGLQVPKLQLGGEMDYNGVFLNPPLKTTEMINLQTLLEAATSTGYYPNETLEKIITEVSGFDKKFLHLSSV